MESLHLRVRSRAQVDSGAATRSKAVATGAAARNKDDEDELLLLRRTLRANRAGKENASPAPTPAAKARRSVGPSPSTPGAAGFSGDELYALRLVFSSFDADGAGRISRADLSLYAEAVGEPVSPQDVDCVFRAMDASGGQAVGRAPRETRTSFAAATRPRTVRVAAAASPRPVATERPRRGRGVAATRLQGTYESLRYAPVFREYSRVCVDGGGTRGNGTFAARNLYAVAYNYAAVDGRAALAEGRDARATGRDFLASRVASRGRH